MKKLVATTALVLALVAGVASVASTATAHPYKTRACSACHGSSSAVTITLTRKSATTKTVTYAIKVTGGKGKAGWAVMSGTTNLAHRSYYTGTFTVAKGKTVKVWAVKTGSGARYRYLTVK